MFGCFEDKIKSSWVSLASFCAKIHDILTKIFFCHINGINNEMTKIDAGKVWVQNLVILGWIPTSAGFRVKTVEILTKTFLSYTYGNKKWTKKNLGMFWV